MIDHSLDQSIRGGFENNEFFSLLPVFQLPIPERCGGSTSKQSYIPIKTGVFWNDRDGDESTIDSWD